MGAKASLGLEKNLATYGSGRLGMLVRTGREKEAGGGEALEDDG